MQADNPGAAQIGPYRLEGPLGTGGMGTVWRAWDERLQRHVAIKQVRSDSVTHAQARLRREATESVAREWLRTDPAAARAWLRSVGATDLIPGQGG